MLGRLPLPDSTSKMKSNEMNFYVHSVIKLSQISEDFLQQIITETQNEDIYQSVVLQIQNGRVDPNTTKGKPHLTVRD